MAEHGKGPPMLAGGTGGGAEADRLRAGRCMDYDAASPEVIADAIAAEIDRPVATLPVEAGGPGSGADRPRSSEARDARNVPSRPRGHDTEPTAGCRRQRLRSVPAARQAPLWKR